MLPYQENRELEILLKQLFEDEDGSALEGVTILRESSLPGLSAECCTYNYTSYSV